MATTLDFRPSTMRGLEDEIKAEELLRRVCKGESDALAGLYGQYRGLVFTVAYRILKHTGEAEDLMRIPGQGELDSGVNAKSIPG